MDQAVIALLGHAALAGKRLDRIARDQADQREDEQRDADEGRNDEGDALENEGKHAAALAVAVGYWPVMSTLLK